MGCSCNIYLPSDVRADHIADVMAILTGSKATQTSLRGSNGVFVNLNPEPSFSSSDIGHGNIDLHTEFAKKHHIRPFIYHGATFEGKAYTEIIFSSTPVKVAIASRLIHWFGGIVVANDSGDGLVTHRNKRHCPIEEDGTLPCDAEPWDDYQRALLKLRPLQKREIEAAKKYAAYTEGE